MSEPQKKPTIVARTYLHSAYVNNIGNGNDALVVSEIVEDDQGNIEPQLRIFNKPMVSFWVTQQQYRSHPDKKEFETLRHLDEHIVPYKDREREMFRIFKGFYPNHLTPNQRREVLQSPYLYGGNITVEARVAMKYKDDLKKAGKVAHSPTTGFFDIEKSLLKSSYGKLPLMVFTAENKVYLAMKNSFMYEERNGKIVPVTIDDVRQAAHEYIDPLVASIFSETNDLKDHKHKLPFEYHFFSADTEVEMIRWIWDRMHESKTSFIGIWNLGFDIPEIIKVLDEAGIPLEDIFADPSLRGTGYAAASFRPDMRDVAHFTQKWHWMTNTAHFQFVDSMSLYSYIRIVDGKEASYALDDILKKFGLGGKLKIDTTKELDGLQTEDWHREMLSRFFVPYALYAMWDGMALQLLEWRNNDMGSMMVMTDTTHPKFFPNQTIRVTNTLFQEWKPRGYILGTGIDVEAERDDDLLTTGGAVLEPQKLVGNGMRLFKEWPNHATRCYAWQNDLDFSAQYPTNIAVLNISKQTKTSTMFAIRGEQVQARYKPDEAVEALCTYLVTNNSSGYELGTEFFGLPTYAEMDRLFKERQTT